MQTHQCGREKKGSGKGGCWEKQQRFFMKKWPESVKELTFSALCSINVAISITPYLHSIQHQYLQSTCLSSLQTLLSTFSPWDIQPCIEVTRPYVLSVKQNLTKLLNISMPISKCSRAIWSPSSLWMSIRKHLWPSSELLMTGESANWEWNSSF